MLFASSVQIRCKINSSANLVSNQFAWNCSEKYHEDNVDKMLQNATTYLEIRATHWPGVSIVNVEHVNTGWEAG